MTRSLHVPVDAKGERIDQFLARAFPDLSRSRLHQLLAQGHLTLDGKTPKPAARLKGGEQVMLALPPPPPSKLVPEDLPLEILYEDGAVLVVNKAVGQVVHPGAGHWTGTLANALLHHVEALRGNNESLRPGLVHRLDKDTSGCLVVAKTPVALERLQTAFASHQVEKTYWALVHGHPAAQGRIETLYGRHPVHRKRFSGKVKKGKLAVTTFRVLQLLEGAAWVEVGLHTGRTHQIRVHFSESGHPLLADALYGKPRGIPSGLKAVEQGLGRQALHARRLSFPHPDDGHMVSVEAPMPADFQRALERVSESGRGK